MCETLAIHPGALGDVLLAVPALRALRAAHPQHSLVLAAQPRIGRLLVTLGEVDRAIDFDTLGLDRLFVCSGDDCRGVGESSSDRGWRAVGTGGRVQRLVCWFGARDPVFVRQLSRLVPGAVIASPSTGSGELVWRHLLGTVGGRGGDVRPLFVPAALRDEGRRMLTAAGWTGTDPLVLVHPGAGGAAKRWPAAGFAEVVHTLAAGSAAVVLHEGPADHEAVADLTSRLSPTPPVLREPTLPLLAGALCHADAWLGNDSGVSHLAAGVGTPAVVLFAESNLAWRPWSPTAQVRSVAISMTAPRDLMAIRADLEARLAR